MTKKYQVFISSTFKDLVQERQETIRSVLDLAHIPSGMEIFPAADIEQFEYIKKVVDECDYYVLIIGARYGSTDAAGVSFTEKEYDYAVEQKKTVLAFIHGNPGLIPVVNVDTDVALAAKLRAFREKVSTGRLVQSWKSSDELKSKVIIALSKAFTDAPGVGWIRGNAVASEDLLAQINQLRNENDALRAHNAELEEQTRPRLDGLAGLNESFKVRYAYRKWQGSNVSDHSDEIQLTWAEIFVAIGPSLIQPHAPTMISSLIMKYVKENKGIKRDSMSVFDTDENTIKFQLVALGLIHAASLNKVGGGVGEFVSLSDRGRQRLIELVAVKSSGANAQ